MPLRTRLKVGVPKAEAAAFAQQISALAAKYPADALVQVTLAEAEQDAHQYVAAEAAADRALAADPRWIEAMIFKGRAMIEHAAFDQNGVTFAAARSWFQKANKLDPEEYRAADAVPRGADQGFRQTQCERDRRFALCLGTGAAGPSACACNRRFNICATASWRRRNALAPVAYDPHGGGYARSARSAIERIDGNDSRRVRKRP